MSVRDALSDQTRTLTARENAVFPYKDGEITISVFHKIQTCLFPPGMVSSVRMRTGGERERQFRWMSPASPDWSWGQEETAVASGGGRGGDGDDCGDQDLGGRTRHARSSPKAKLL